MLSAGAVVRLVRSKIFQLSRFQPVNPASFARRAGLTAGQVAGVLLTVEVLPNGRTGTVEVLRGFGDAMVDAAAVAYARQTALDSRDSESSRTTDAHQFAGRSGLECIVGSRSNRRTSAATH